MAKTAAMRRVAVAARWAMIALVGAAMAVFIVFDVLDLDGSNLRRPASGSGLTADGAASETERLLFHTPDRSAALGGEPAATRRSSSTYAGITGPDTSPPVLRPRRTAVHLHAWQDALHGTPTSPDDPA